MFTNLQTNMVLMLMDTGTLHTRIMYQHYFSCDTVGFNSGLFELIVDIIYYVVVYYYICI